MIFLSYLLLGAAAGMAAGLLGIGGGVIIVPGLLALFALQNFPPEWIMHMAIATSLAAVMITTFAAAWVHYRMGAIQWGLFRFIAIGMVAGGICGPFIAQHLSSPLLRMLAGILLLLISAYMFFPKLSAMTRPMPRPLGLSARATLIGSFSTMLGIGSGIFLVPLLHSYSVPMRQAVATTSACMLSLGLTGTITYIAVSLDVTGLPDYHLGFIFLPALLGLVITSSFFAPLGARLVHVLPVAILKRAFAILLMLVAIRMLWG